MNGPGSRRAGLRKALPFLVAGVGAVGLVGIALAMLVVRCETPPRVNAGPIPSPDGTKLLVTRVNRSHADPRTFLDVEFDIVAAKSGLVRFHTVTAASARMKWSMHWLGSDQVRLESSDVGDLCWKESPAGSWAATACPH